MSVHVGGKLIGAEYCEGGSGCASHSARSGMEHGKFEGTQPCAQGLGGQEASRHETITGYLQMEPGPMRKREDGRGRAYQRQTRGKGMTAATGRLGMSEEWARTQ